MDRQQTAYGDRGGVLKLAGGYTATSSLVFDGSTSPIFFNGRYSSTANDSSWFYCDRTMTDQFGTLFFTESGGSTGTFTSQKYGYAFPFTSTWLTLDFFLDLFRNLF
jgi:hypothetical protein